MPRARSRRSSSAARSPVLEHGRDLPDGAGVVGGVFQQAELDPQGDELLLRPVVQVPLDLPPFGVLRLDQPAARGPQFVDGGPQVGGELGVAQHEARLGGQVLQQLVLGAGQRLGPGLAQGQRAEQFAGVPDGDRTRRRLERRQPAAGIERDRGRRDGSARPDRGRAQLPADPDPRLGLVRPGRAGQDGYHPVHGVGEVQLPGHVLGEVGQHLVGRGPLAVHQAVGELPEAVPQRLEQHGDADRRGDREQRAAAMPGERADAQHDARVHDRERRRQQAVDHRPADDHVNVEQPVPENRDRHRRRDPEQRDDRYHGVARFRTARAGRAG